MATRQIILPDDVLQVAEAQVASGRFASIEEVVRAAVAALEREEQLGAAKLSELRAAIDDGDASGTFAGDPFEGVRDKYGLSSAR